MSYLYNLKAYDNFYYNMVLLEIKAKSEEQAKEKAKELIKRDIYVVDNIKEVVK